MAFVRAIGWMMVFPAVLVLSYGLVIWFQGVPVFDLPAAEFLASRGAPGPDFVQSAAQRVMPEALADPRSLRILLFPVAEALAILAGLMAVPGMVVLILFRRGWSGALILRQYSR